MSAPDGHPESGDASHFDFDDLVLDEEFVRAATIREATATARVERKRQQEVRRADRFPRPQWRRLRSGSARRTTNPRRSKARPDDPRVRPAPEAPRFAEWTAAQWTAVVSAIVLAGAFVWLLAGPRSSSPSAVVATPSQTAPRGAPDQVGACRGLQSSGDQVAAFEVPCTSLHSVEVTNYTPLPSQTVSNTASVQVQKSCLFAALQYAGGALPSNVKSSYLAPTATEWSAGDHSAECTIFQVDISGNLVPMTGTLRNSED